VNAIERLLFMMLLRGAEHINYNGATAYGGSGALLRADIGAERLIGVYGRTA